MADIRKILEKAPFLANGGMLVGMAFVLAGVLVTRLGGIGLWGVWQRSEALRPFKIPASQIILISLPVIVKIFVIVLSSVSAVMIGVLWFGSGVAETIRAWKRSGIAAELAHSGLVAESMRTNTIRNWDREPLFLRVISLVWSKARVMTPASYRVFTDLVRAVFGLIVWILLIAMLKFGLEHLPLLVKQVLKRDLVLIIPSMGPLYSLVGLLAVMYTLAALSLLPMGKPSCRSMGRRIGVKGRGNSSLFFALLEEGCRLLIPKGSTVGTTARLQDSSDPLVRGTLVEGPPGPDLAFATPSAYLCLPLFVALVFYGFAGLIGFDKPEDKMPYQEFLSGHLLEYLVRIVFCFGLVICGLNAAELAGKLFALTRYRSSGVFSRVKIKSMRDSQVEEAPSGDGGGTRLWKTMAGVDEQFSTWVKDSSSQTRFEIEIWWAEILSEAESLEEPRHVVGLFQSEALDAALSRIIQIPFRVGFEADTTPERSLTSRNRASDQSEDASNTETV